MANKKAKYSDWDYKSSYKSRPQIRISNRAYRVLSKGKGSMAEQIDCLLGLSSEKLSNDLAPVDVFIDFSPIFQIFEGKILDSLLQKHLKLLGDY